MRVNIEHREERLGLIRKRTFFFVDLNVTFSDEETQIIKERDLGPEIVLERGVPAHRDDGKWTPGMADIFNLRIRDLFTADSYSFYTPAEAKEYEEQLRIVLPELKAYIMENEAVEEKSSSFEL